MKDEPKVSCLCITYGRFGVLRQALACFLQQDYPNRQLIIYNDHPVPIICNEPGVTVVNEKPLVVDNTLLPRLRRRALSFVSGDVLCFWDDDDLYFPYHISSSISEKQKRGASAYKHGEFWFLDVAARRASLSRNVAECTFFVDREVLGDISKLEFAFGGISGWPQSVIDSVQSKDMGVFSSYVYQWANGVHHTSGRVNNLSMQDCWNDFRAHSNDSGNGLPLTPDYQTVEERLALCK